MFDTSFNFIKKIKRNFFPFYKKKEIQYVFNKLQEGFPKETITARFVEVVLGSTYPMMKLTI